MNRPRNRQTRPPRGNSASGGRGRGGGPSQDRNARWRAGTPQQAAGTVPTMSQVIPGASVFIILKDDQPTGRETYGIVQDLLTRGNHPRGIKVRLRGGLVGRVQRMGQQNGEDVTEVYEDESTTSRRNPLVGDYNESTMASQGRGQSPSMGGRPAFGTARIKYHDIRGDGDGGEGPPQRSLADYLPAAFGEPNVGKDSSSAPVAKCPFCEDFEGDEVAVSYHVDQKHLS